MTLVSCLTVTLGTPPRLPMLARRAALPLYPGSGAEASLGEDLAVWRRLAANGPVVRLAGAAHLYVGSNGPAFTL